MFLSFEIQKLKSDVNNILLVIEKMFYTNLIRLCAFKYRDRSTILVEVLKTIECTPKGKGAIMRRASLSYVQVNKYLLFLANKGYVVETSTQYGKKYEVTGKGSTFLRNLETLHLHFSGTR